jgi:hypothetical protein
MTSCSFILSAAVASLLLTRGGTSTRLSSGRGGLICEFVKQAAGKLIEVCKENPLIVAGASAALAAGGAAMYYAKSGKPNAFKKKRKGSKRKSNAPSSSSSSSLTESKKPLEHVLSQIKSMKAREYAAVAIRPAIRDFKSNPIYRGYEKAVVGNWGRCPSERELVPMMIRSVFHILSTASPKPGPNCKVGVLPPEIWLLVSEFAWRDIGQENQKNAFRQFLTSSLNQFPDIVKNKEFVKIIDSGILVDKYFLNGFNFDNKHKRITIEDKNSMSYSGNGPRCLREDVQGENDYNSCDIFSGVVFLVNVLEDMKSPDSNTVSRNTYYANIDDIAAEASIYEADEKNLSEGSILARRGSAPAQELSVLTNEKCSKVCVDCFRFHSFSSRMTSLNHLFVLVLTETRSVQDSRF